MAVNISEELKNMAEKTEKKSHDLGEQLGEFIANIDNKTNSYKDQVDGYVKENPKTSLAIAAAAGLVLGGLLVLAFKNNNNSSNNK